jgi:hypothetical protein
MDHGWHFRGLLLQSGESQPKRFDLRRGRRPRGLRNRGWNENHFLQDGAL